MTSMKLNQRSTIGCRSNSCASLFKTQRFMSDVGIRIVPRQSDINHSSSPLGRT